MIRPALVPLLAALAACAPGPVEETLVTRLTVVGAVAEPPEAAPGERVDLAVTVADPNGRGADVLVWQCTDLGQGCLEAGDDFATWASVGPLVDQAFATTVTPSPAFAAALADPAAEARLPVWTLACEPGLCPVIGRAEAALRAGGPAPADLAEDLADPTRWLGDLPVEGVTLALRTVAVSTRPPAERNANPEVSVEDPEGLVIDPEGRIDLDLTVHDDGGWAEAVAFGLSTAGGFGLPAFEVAQGEAVLSWYAPEEPGSVDLFVVVEDGEGGSAVWRGTAVVGAR